MCVGGAGDVDVMKRTLVDLYQSTNGANWFDKSHWLTGDPCTSTMHWYGVKCNGTVVVSLRLHDNNLTGTLPSLSAMEDLEKADFSHNFIRGPLPDLPAQFRELELYRNRIVGTIPTSYSTLSSLHVLYLSNNALTGLIPEWVCDIEFWNLEYNKFACDSRPICCTEKPYCGTCIDDDSTHTTIIIVLFVVIAVTTAAIIITLLYKRMCAGRTYETENWAEAKGFLQNDGSDVFDSDDDDEFEKEGNKEEMNEYY